MSECGAVFVLAVKGGGTRETFCLLPEGHRGQEHKARKPGGVVRWRARKNRNPQEQK